MNINEPDHEPGFSLPFHNQHNPTLKDRGSAPKSNRLPYLSWMSDDVRNHFVAMVGEFVGTTLFLLFAFAGTQVALYSQVAETGNQVDGQSDPSQLMYISLCFGFSLAVNAWIFFRISGGLFNPAVAIGMCLVGALPYVRGGLLIIVEILGGIAAAGIVSALFPGPLSVQSKLSHGTSITQGLFIEMFLTAQLLFTIFMLAAEKHRGTFIAPIGIGLSLFIAELTGVYFTGGSCNPARSFGPSVIDHTFPGYHWIYWVGPMLGSLLASAFYKFIKMLEYETANPGQDGDQQNNYNPAPSHHFIIAPAKGNRDLEGAREFAIPCDDDDNNNSNGDHDVLLNVDQNQAMPPNPNGHRRAESDDTLTSPSRGHSELATNATPDGKVIPNRVSSARLTANSGDNSGAQR